MNRIISMSITVLIVITICLVTISVTYSWFITSHVSNNVNSASSGKLEIIYDKGQDVNGILKPSSSKNNGLSASVKIKQGDNSVDALGTVTLNVTNIDSALSVKGLKWELYKDSSVSPIANGTFEGVTSNSQINLITDYLLTTDNTTFTLYIWLNGSEVNNSVMNKTFSAYISATARSKPVNIK